MKAGACARLAPWPLEPASPEVAAVTAVTSVRHSLERRRRAGGAMALTEKQLRHLEDRLREERERALRVIRRYDEGRSNPAEDGDLTNYPFHLADQGTDTFDQELSTELAERATR